MRNEQDVWRDVQAMEKIAKNSNVVRRRKENGFRAAKQGEGREAVAEGEGMEERKRERGVEKCSP